MNPLSVSHSTQFSHSVVSDSLQPMDCGTPGLPVHHQIMEFTQTHVHQVGDAIQPSHPLSSPSPASLVAQLVIREMALKTSSYKMRESFFSSVSFCFVLFCFVFNDYQRAGNVLFVVLPRDCRFLNFLSRGSWSKPITKNPT